MMEVFCTQYQINTVSEKGFTILLSLIWDRLCHSHGAEALVLDTGQITHTHAGLYLFPILCFLFKTILSQHLVNVKVLSQVSPDSIS